MFGILAAADQGLNLHVKGLPKWMTVKNIDHLSAKEKSRIVRARPSSVYVSAVANTAGGGNTDRAPVMPCEQRRAHLRPRPR